MYLTRELAKKSIRLLAKELEISAQTLCEWLEKLGIEAPKKIISSRRKMPSKELLFDWYITQKKSQQDLAGQFNVHQATVSKWLKYYKIKTNFKGKSNLQNINSETKNPGKIKLIELYRSKGLSQREIAKEYGVKQISVYRWMKEYNLPQRSRTTAQTIKHGIGVIKPSKEFLQDLYINQQKSAFEIAQLFQVDNSTATDWLKEFGIERREPLFGRKGYICCGDGHHVRSQKERKVCEWLTTHKIDHLYEPSSKLIKKKFQIPKAVYRKAICPDFLVGNTIIEVWAQDTKMSFTDINGVYNPKMIEKKKMYDEFKNYGINFVEIYADEDVDKKLGLILKSEQ